MQQPKEKDQSFYKKSPQEAENASFPSIKWKNRKIQKGAERSDTPTDLAIQYHSEAHLAAAVRAKPWMLRFHLDRNG